MRCAAAIVLPLLLVLALAAWRAEGPAPRPANAPDGEFSAVRAIGTLRTVLAEGVPHPVGTAAQVRVRDRIVTRFRELGYETSIQRRFACNAHALCAMAENIIARPRGDARGEAVLLVAHYDSVASGPGVSDDGLGVATLLETARAVRAERTGNPIVFLVTDAEEAGLLGAEAFVADESLVRGVGAIVNVEDRGTYGTSNMFETSRGNLWLIRHFAGSVARPQATSFYSTVYELLPNDTDVSVFKRAGKASVNFAAIRGVNWYHTPFDDFSHASLRTLQHHGDNALAMARALADADLAARSRRDATYFDILGFALVWWPASATPWIAIGGFVLFIFAARRANPRAMTFGVLATFIALLFSLLGGVALSSLARLHSDGAKWVAHPLSSVAAMWLIGVAASIFAFALFRLRGDARSQLLGAAIVWHAIGIVLAFTLTGTSFLFIVPAAAITICILAGANETVISAIGATAAAILIFPISVVLYDALGGPMMSALAILIGITFTLAAPLIARYRAAAMVAAAAVVCALVAMWQPPYSPERPRQLSVSYVDDPDAGAMWMTPKLTPPLQQAARFARANASLTPWSRATQWSAPAPALNQPRVVVTGTRNGSHVAIRVRSQRDANRLVVVVKGGTIASINGVAPAPRPARFREWSSNGWRWAAAEGVQERVVDVIAAGPVDVVASDVTYGLPPFGTALANARNASMAMPAHDGDVTITRARWNAGVPPAVPQASRLRP